MKISMRIGHKISLLVIFTALLATAVSAWIGYRSARDNYLTGIDRQLTAAVAAIPLVIGENYFSRALSQKNVQDKEYNRLVHTLNDLADRSQVYYLYVFAQDGDQVVHLATSASPIERASENWATFLTPYEEPPPELLLTFQDGQTRFAEYTDEFGSFRSIFVRHDGPSGRSYTVGADVTLKDIQVNLNAILWQFLTIGTMVMLCTGLLGMLLSRRLSRSLQIVTREVDRWANREFDSDETIRTHLQEVARARRDEIGFLAARFSRMVESYGQISDVCKAIASGDFNQRVSSRSNNDFLAEAINQVAQERQKAEEEVKDYTTRLEQRAAMESSLSQLKTNLQGELGLPDVGTRGLETLVTFLDAPAGALFALTPDRRIHCLATFAYPEDTHRPESFVLGHGTVGQVAQSGIPKTVEQGDTNLHITFGFGKVPPLQVLMTPLLINKQIVGVLELCLFHPLTSRQTQWLNQALETIANTLRFTQESNKHKEAEERNRLLLECVAEGIFGVDTAGRITFVNSAACHILGYRTEELIGQHSHACIHHHRPDGSTYPVEECPMFIAYTHGTESRIDDEFLWCKNGQGLSVTYSATPIRKGDALLGAVISFTALTDRKQGEP